MRLEIEDNEYSKRKNEYKGTKSADPSISKDNQPAAAGFSEADTEPFEVEPLSNQLNPVIQTVSDSDGTKRCGRLRDWAWEHFIQNPTNSRNGKATCKHCSTLVSARHMRLVVHLENRHPGLVKDQGLFCSFILSLFPISFFI